VQRAWDHARDVGVYRFATDLGESIYPARSLSNAGRGPQRVNLHMEGDVDLPARTLEFRLWQPGMAPGPYAGLLGRQAGVGGMAPSPLGAVETGQTGAGGSVMTPDSGAEARIEGDRAYMRPVGGEWKQVQDFSTSFAPGNDPLAFLGGIKDVRAAPAEEASSRGAEEQGSGGAGEEASIFHVSRFSWTVLPSPPTCATSSSAN
jgi:hypothetical protein